MGLGRQFLDSFPPRLGRPIRANEQTLGLVGDNFVHDLVQLAERGVDPKEPFGTPTFVERARFPSPKNRTKGIFRSGKNVHFRGAHI